MTLEDEVNPDLNVEFTFNELHSAFYDLPTEFKKAGIKNKSLKQSNDALLKERNEFSKKFESLQEDF